MKLDGKEKARKAILPIKNDTRIPMMEIYRLFRGETTPEKVLKVLDSANSSAELAKQQTFDAHLYLALYFDSEDNLPQAAKHVDLAVRQFKKGDYMWAVAVEHKKHLQRRMAKRKKIE
jgi:lipoprotein NlpI